MGLRKGVEVRCDRCGANEFFIEGSGISVETIIDKSGWDIRYGKWLCPNCVNSFDKLIDKFFDEVFDR